MSGHPPFRCVIILLRDLVDAIDIGALFSIHLDVDELRVHEPRGGFVLERIRVPSRGTSGRPESPMESRIGLSCGRLQAPGLPGPTDTSPAPGYARAAADRGAESRSGLGQFASRNRFPVECADYTCPQTHRFSSSSAAKIAAFAPDTPVVFSNEIDQCR